MSRLFHGALFSLDFIRRNGHLTNLGTKPKKWTHFVRRSNMAQIEPLEPPNTCEPPLRPSRSSLFFIGRDNRGNWVARDRAGLCGGLFVNRSEALRFAMQENGRRSRAVIMVPGILELTADFWPDRVVTDRPQVRGLNVAAHC